MQGHAYKVRENVTLKDGWLVVFSDAHYWPGEAPVAHEALIMVVKELKPKLVIANGDVFDGANISRHEPMGWQTLPTVREELDVVKKRLGEIEQASPKSSLLMTVGNHDSRFDRRLATEIPEFKDVSGMRLSNHIPSWPLSYTVLINEDVEPIFVLHNIKGGVHAPYNNTKSAGCSVITGHLHSQKAQPYSTLLHDWEGIDAGCLADKDHPAFSYAMDRPRDWRSGFVAIRFDKEGRHYPAEFCRVIWRKKESVAIWRSEVIYTRKVKLDK
jgi:predicted phosphodiesterase